MHAYNVFYALLPPGNLSPANTFPSQLHFLFLFLLLNNPLSPVSTAYHTRAWKHSLGCKYFAPGHIPKEI